MDILELLNKIDTDRIWDREPVFCFTSDIDWASEAVLDRYFSNVCSRDLKLTVFVTHSSQIINQLHDSGLIQRGIHPNFLQHSSHGRDFRQVIETCRSFAPEARGFRSHRLFDVTDITHLLHDEYGFRYVSNLGTIMQRKIRPLLHESGLVHFPIFFEDGTHLFNRLSFDMSAYLARFVSPGIKIISVHPMNYVINTPETAYMRRLKDSQSRDEYNQMTSGDIATHEHAGVGVRRFVDDIIAVAKAHRTMFLSEMYELAIS